MRKYILVFYVKGTRGIVKDLRGRVYLSANFETRKKAWRATFWSWRMYYRFVIRVTLTGKNKMGTPIKF